MRCCVSLRRSKDYLRIQLTPPMDSRVASSPWQAIAALLLAVAISALASCSEGDRNEFSAGAAAVDITPDAWPLPLIGSFRYRPATSAHDPLHSRALAVRSGDSTVAIAVVDSCYIPRDTTDEAKRRIEASSGLPADRVLVAATHTHSAPPPAPGIGLRGLEAEKHEENEARYAERLIQGIAASVIQAIARLEPAQVGWATASLPGQVFNRRWYMSEGSIPPDPFGGTTDRVRMNPPFADPDLVRPSGPVDPEVAVLSFVSARGEPIAIVANYSLHYVGGIPAGQVSADYFGEFTRTIASRLGAGANFVAMLSNGTSGNINNLDFSKPRVRKEPFEQVRHVASELADVVAAAYEEIKHVAVADVAMEQSELSLARRKPSRSLLNRSRQLLEEPPESVTARQVIYAQRAIALHDGPENVSVILQAIRIGEVGIAALPFETFVETGLAIKDQSPLRPSFVIELANGAEKYLPTPEHHELGGYETWLGTSTVEKQASVMIESELLGLLRTVAKDSR